jgi:hypothetical protein
VRPRALLVALAGVLVVAAAGGPPGTDAVSSVEADRDVGGVVVPDERAYLGVVPVEDPTATGTAADVELLELANGFHEPVRVSASAPDSTRLRDLAADPGEVGPAESTFLAGTVDCEGVDRVRAEVRLTATGDDTEVTLFRTVTVSCVAGSAGAGTGDGGVLAVDAAGQLGSGSESASGLTVGSVTNRGDRTLRVDVTLTEAEPNDDPHVTITGAPGELAPGETRDVRADLACGGEESEVVTLEATATPANGTGTATASDTFVVDCDA